MSKELTPELKKEITSKADEYIKSSEHEGTGYGAYLNGATVYALKWQEAEQKAERYEKALNQLKLHIISCRNHLINPDGLNMLRTIDEALTPKQTNDDDTVNG